MDGFSVTEQMRKQVARIISPKAKFDDFEGITWSQFDMDRRRVAYEKADAVIALLVPLALADRNTSK